MAGLSQTQIAQLNAAGSRSRKRSTSAGTKGYSPELLKLANALANGNVAYNSDPLAGSQKKLNDSIQAIIASNAPGGFKNAAAKYGTGDKPKQDKSVFDTVKDALGTGISGVGRLLSFPETLVTQPVRRLIDPSRNLLKDITSGETTSSALAGADWFKGLPTPAKIAIGITSDIATDPLTYLLGAGVISKLGQAPGIIAKIEEAIPILKTAGRIEEADRLMQFGGNLARKGTGGIGGIKNADLAWIGKTLEETGVADLGGQTLKGGLYFQPPGTGRVASFGKKLVTGEGIDSAKYQIYLGRGPVVEKVSATASNLMNRSKTSKMMSVLGDAYGGGEGQIKRKILNASTPQEALNYRRVLVSDRIKNGTESIITKMMERRAAVVDKAVKDAGVDRTVVVGALDGNVDDIALLNSKVNGMADMIRGLDDQLITETTDHIRRVVEQFGGDVNDVQPLVERAKDHLHGVLTDEARSGMKASGKVKYANDGVDGFMLPAKFVPGANHLGTPIADATDTLTRAVWVDKKGVQHVLLGEANKPAVAMAAEHGVGPAAEQAVLAKVGQTLEGNATAAEKLGIDGPVTQVRYLDSDGKLVSTQLPTNEIQFQQIAPNGLGAKTQVNAVNRAKYGHDLFSTDYRQIVQKQIRDFSRAAGNEVQGLYLKRFGLAASKGEEKSVAASIAASRGIEVSVDAAADPAFQTAVVANIDDPAKVQVAAIAANGMADARTSLPAEPASFSILSLSPEEAQVHIDGVLEDVRVQADALASRSASARPESVKGIDAAIERTRARVDFADLHLQRIDSLIAEADAAGIDTARIAAWEPSPKPADFVPTKADDPIPELFHGTSNAFPDNSLYDGSFWERPQADNLVGGGFYTTDNPEIGLSYLKKGRRSASDPAMYDVRWTGQQPPRVLDLNETMASQEIIDSVVARLNAATNWDLSEEMISELAGSAGKITTFNLFGEVRKILADAGEPILKYEADEFITDAITEPLRQSFDVLKHNGGVQGGTKHNVYVWINEGNVSAVRKTELPSFNPPENYPIAVGIEELRSIRESIMVTKQSDIDAIRMMTDRKIDENAYKAWMASADAQQGLANAVLDGWTGISRSTQVPDQLHEVMALLTKATGPDQLPGIFRYFDKLTNLFKSWAIASPGFVMRNGIGGMFNNYLIGVDAGRYWEFMKADRAFMRTLNRTGDVEKALTAVPGRLNKQYRLLHSSGVLSETDRISDAAFGLTKSLGQGTETRDAFGWLGNNKITRGVYDANSRMERVLRGAAGMDAAAKTGTLDGIYESVFKAHFDYADLNRFEVNWMKRVSPFYTWTRKNLPLQMEMLFKNPKAYNRYNIFKKNIESVTPEEDLVPSWMRDRLNIRLPFTNKDGQMYILPDLPFTSLNMFTNADELAGQINPVLKTPVEMLMDRKLYFGRSAPFTEGYVQMPDVLTKTGIAHVMAAAGLAERDKNGNFMTRDKTLYAAEQFLPFFGRMRRLLPSEKKYDERAATTWLNFLFGTGLRTNTMTDKSSELYFRQRSVDQIAKDLNSLGYGGYTYWNKRVELSRKPTASDKNPYLTLNQPKGGLGFDSPYTNVRGQTDFAALAQALSSSGKRN